MNPLAIGELLFDFRQPEPLRVSCPEIEPDLAEAVLKLCLEIDNPASGRDWPDSLLLLRIADRSLIVRTLGRRFSVLVPAPELWRDVHDPFLLSEKWPPQWTAQGEIPAAEWSDPPPSRRNVQELQNILKPGGGPFLLAAAQVLVDGGFIVLKQQEPESEQLRPLWQLLPDSNRRELTLATFSFALLPDVRLTVLGDLPERELTGYLTADMVLNYPESRYERDLQIVVEAGDERGLQKLLYRRSSREVARLAVGLVVGMFLLSGIVKILSVVK